MFKKSFTRRPLYRILSCAALASAACHSELTPSGGDDVQVESNSRLSFEEFRDSTAIDPVHGHYLVEGDLRIRTEEELEDYYDALHDPRALTVGMSGPAGAQVDIKYSDTQKMDLSYCIGSGFTAAQKTALVAAMNAAVAEWEAATRVGTGAATIDFKYLSAKDGAGCTNANNTVFFNVQKAPAGASYNAAAFFPDWGRADRTLDVAPSAFSLSAPKTLTGVLRHELGHVLGFPHEHVRNPAAVCIDPSAPAQFRGISVYEAASVMHYQNAVVTSTGDCASSGVADYILSTYDKAGARCIYNPAADACQALEISGLAPGFTADGTGTVYRVKADNTGIEHYKVVTAGVKPTWKLLSTVSNTSRILAGGTKLYRVSTAVNGLSRLDGATWTALGNAGSQVVVTGKGDLFRLESDGKISRIAATASSPVAAYATAGTGRQLFAGPTTVFRVDSDQKAYRWNSGTSWTQIASGVVEVAQDGFTGTGGQRLYARASDGRVFRANSAGVWSQIGVGASKLYGGLADTLYAKATGTNTVMRFSQKRSRFEDYALNVADFFGGENRKLSRQVGTGKLFDYLYSE